MPIRIFNKDFFSKGDQILWKLNFIEEMLNRKNT